MNKCVFLDRDGVLNQDPPHYVHKIEDMVILPRVGDAIKLLNEEGWQVIVVSNQSGVGRGMYTQNDVYFFNNYLFYRIYKDSGGVVTDSLFCPHHPEHGIGEYKVDCECRKPKPGLILKAAKHHDIDLPNSWLIGDKRTDMEAAMAAGVRPILVLTGHGKEEVKKPGVSRVSNDLYSAVTEYIV